jgi:hypothetical protein
MPASYPERVALHTRTAGFVTKGVRVRGGPTRPPGVQLWEVRMLVLGIILMLIGFLLSIPVLWTIGIILAVVGAVLWVAEGTGAAWGRRWY